VLSATYSKVHRDVVKYLKEQPMLKFVVNAAILREQIHAANLKVGKNARSANYSRILQDAVN